MRMRTVGVHVRRFLFPPTVAVRMPVPMAMSFGLGDCMTARIPLMSVTVVMVVTMGGRCVGRLWHPTLLANLSGFRHFVIVLSSASFRMCHEPLQRGFVHVARQRNT